MGSLLQEDRWAHRCGQSAAQKPLQLHYSLKPHQNRLRQNPIRKRTLGHEIRQMRGKLVDRNQPVEDFSSKLIRSECWRRTGSGWRSGDGRQDGTGPHSRSTADDRASNSDSAASPTGTKTKMSHPFASFIILMMRVRGRGSPLLWLCSADASELTGLSSRLSAYSPGWGLLGTEQLPFATRNTHLVQNPPLTLDGTVPWTYTSYHSSTR